MAMITTRTAQRDSRGLSLAATVRRWTIPALSAAVVIINIIVPAWAADIIKVTLGQDPTIQLPTRVATIVIGNPLIADATVTSGNMMVITGKSYGTTNIILLDQMGTVLMEKSVLVRAPDNLVAVYYAASRQSFKCNPTCGPTHLLGDGADLTQGQARPADKTVHVQSYTRRDGVHVNSYDRAPPGQGSGRRPDR